MDKEQKPKKRKRNDGEDNGHVEQKLAAKKNMMMAMATRAMVIIMMGVMRMIVASRTIRQPTEHKRKLASDRRQRGGRR